MYAIFLGSPAQIQRVYPADIITGIGALVDLKIEPIAVEERAQHRQALENADFIFSTWGMAKLSEEEIANELPNLKRVFYAAGSVQYFARPYLARGIGVSSAWAANAVPVVEVAVSLILLSLKGYFPGMKLASAGHWREGGALASRYPHIYGATVGILGAGMIGAQVAKELSRHDLKILIYDPYCSEEKARSLGAEKVKTLEEIFSRSAVISNHIANLPATKGMLKEEHFARLPKYAAFINTGRNAQIDEAGLVKVFSRRADLTFLADVTDPIEPPAAEHPYFSLPNFYLSPHLAGTAGDELARMSLYMKDELARLLSGEPLRWDVTEKMLETMA